MTHTHQVRSPVADLLSAAEGRRDRAARLRHHRRRAVPRALRAALADDQDRRSSLPAADRRQPEPAAPARRDVGRSSTPSSPSSSRRSTCASTRASTRRSKVVANDAGKQTMDQIRTILAEMDHEEARLLDQRAAEAEASAELGRPTIILWGSIAGARAGRPHRLVASRARSTRQIGAGGPARAELVGRAAGRGEPAGDRRARAGDGDDRDRDHDQRAARDVAPDRRERAARRADRRARPRPAARTGDGTVEQGERGDRRHPPPGRPRSSTHMLELGKKSQQIGGDPRDRHRARRADQHPRDQRDDRGGGRGRAGTALRRRRRRDPQARRPRRRLDQGDPRPDRGRPRRGQHDGDGDRGAARKAVDAGRASSARSPRRSSRSPSWCRTTTEAAREIELSTKQQATAVEQVNVAIANVAQATRETEASSSQTLQTASQLAGPVARAAATIIQPAGADRA